MGQVKLGYQVGMQRDDVATVLLYDWDNTLLGVIAVAKGVDNRKIINDYVKTTFVHPELQGSAAHASLARKDTYRGEYPCEGPGVGATFPDGSANPGSKYALTNKLDYVFYGRSKDPAYPYVNGWQAVTPQTMANTWTALETGYTPPTTVDFQNITESTVHAKAIYEPGERLNQGTGGRGYTVSDKASYGIYGPLSVNLGLFSIKFQYYRMNVEGNGVTRIRKPAIQTVMMPDATNATSFILEFPVTNKDTLAVDLTPSKAIANVRYGLCDTYESNIIEGAQISETGMIYNYDPNFNPAMGKVGSEGFVKYSAAAYILEHAYKNKAGDASNKWGAVNNAYLNDAGFKRLADGSSITNAIHSNQAKTQILNCVGAAIAAGEPEVTYYQMQYQIIEKAYANAATAKAYCETNYEWCKP